MVLFWALPKNANRFMILIGNNSMRLYLLHVPLVYFSFTYWPNINPIAMTAINFVGFGLLALGIGLFIEKVHLNTLMGERNFHVHPYE